VVLACAWRRGGVGHARHRQARKRSPSYAAGTPWLMW